MLIIIAAMDRNRVIGKDNKLPWRIAEEVRNFKRLTTGHTVVMGRKTFESIGRALPNRHNIVVSRTLPARDDVVVCRDLDSALERARAYGRDIFIIGGAALYRETLGRADKLYLSYVNGVHAGDTYFPAFNENDWSLQERQSYPDFELCVYVRKGKALE